MKLELYETGPAEVEYKCEYLPTGAISRRGYVRLTFAKMICLSRGKRAMSVSGCWFIRRFCAICCCGSDTVGTFLYLIRGSSWRGGAGSFNHSIPFDCLLS